MSKPEFNNKKWVIGIDLHGTLLNREWQISRELFPELISALSTIREKSYLFVCSGNDLSFVDDVLPSEIKVLMDGFILENGCVFSNGYSEELLIPEEQIKMIKKLESDLKKLDLPEVLFFGHRSGTVSLFTKDRDSGTSPHNLYLYLTNLRQSLPSYEEVHITHSDVAVDILAAGHSKYTGLANICSQSDIIAIADSCNDWEFLSRAALSFVPQNVCPYLREMIVQNGYQTRPLNLFAINSPDTSIYLSEQSYTRGVIDILQKLSDNL